LALSAFSSQWIASSALLELRVKARFVDSGLARDRHDLVAPGLGLGEIFAYPSHLLQSENPGISLSNDSVGVGVAEIS